MIWKCAPIHLLVSPLFSQWGLSRETARSGTGGEVVPCGLGLSTTSVHHVAVLSHWTAVGLALTSFPGKGLLWGVERFRALPNLLLWGPCLYTRRQRSWSLSSLPSPLLESRSCRQDHITANFDLVLDLIAADTWQWSVVMGARLFLET